MHKLVKKYTVFFKAIFLCYSVENFSCFSWQFLGLLSVVDAVFLFTLFLEIEVIIINFRKYE